MVETQASIRSTTHRIAFPFTSFLNLFGWCSVDVQVRQAMLLPSLRISLLLLPRCIISRHSLHTQSSHPAKNLYQSTLDCVVNAMRAIRSYFATELGVNRSGFVEPLLPCACLMSTRRPVRCCTGILCTVYRLTLYTPSPYIMDPFCRRFLFSKTSYCQTHLRSDYQPSVPR